MLFYFRSKIAQPLDKNSQGDKKDGLGIRKPWTVVAKIDPARAFFRRNGTEEGERKNATDKRKGDKERRRKRERQRALGSLELGSKTEGARRGVNNPWKRRMKRNKETGTKRSRRGRLVDWKGS